jgi:hypothetical protein
MLIIVDFFSLTKHQKGAWDMYTQRRHSETFLYIQIFILCDVFVIVFQSNGTDEDTKRGTSSAGTAEKQQETCGPPGFTTGTPTTVVAWEFP